MRYLFIKLALIVAFAFLFIVCKEKKSIHYELYAEGKLMYKIYPKDITYYDTNGVWGKAEFHRMGLRKNFYLGDTIKLKSPIELICKINDEKYFWSNYMPYRQSRPLFWVQFKFGCTCDDDILFNRYNRQKDELTLLTDFECNSIELFHLRETMKYSRKSFYETKEDFHNYLDTARLAHEILFDPYYLNALKESGVEIK